MNLQRNVMSLRQELPLSPHIPSAADMHSMPSWVEDDILLPPQFFQPADRTHNTRGEVALLYAMLDDTVSCLQKGQLSRGHHAQRLAADAELWFFTDDYCSSFSFVNVAPYSDSIQRIYGPASNSGAISTSRGRRQNDDGRRSREHRSSPSESQETYARVDDVTTRGAPSRMPRRLGIRYRMACLLSFPVSHP